MDDQMMNEHARKNGGVQGAHHAGAHGVDSETPPAEDHGSDIGVGALSGSESQDAGRVESDVEPEAELEPVSMKENSHEEQTGQQN